jgi:hypothetical protein
MEIQCALPRSRKAEVTTPHSPPRSRARVDATTAPSKGRGRRECRVFSCTRSLVCEWKKHTSEVTTGTSRTSTFPAQWFSTYCALSPVSMTLIVTVASRIVSARLNTSPGVPGPHAFAVRSSRARRTRCHVHRSPPHDRDDAFVPLVEAGWAQETMILRNSEDKYFSPTSWTNPIFFGFT